MPEMYVLPLGRGGRRRRGVVRAKHMAVTLKSSQGREEGKREGGRDGKRDGGGREVREGKREGRKEGGRETKMV
jgi:hypothetical protein